MFSMTRIGVKVPRENEEGEALQSCTSLVAREITDAVRVAGPLVAHSEQGAMTSLSEVKNTWIGRVAEYTCKETWVR